MRSAPGESLGVALAPHHRGNRQFVDIEVVVDVDHLERALLRLLGGRVRRVPLLPEEFARAQERTGPLLPADDGAPLIDENGQIAVTLHPLGEDRADDGLRRGPDGEALFQLPGAAHRHPCDLGREPLDVLRLLGEHRLGDEQGKVGILDARLLETVVQLALHVLPQAVAVGLEDAAPRDGRVVHHPRAFDDIHEPLIELVVIDIDGLLDKVRCHGGYLPSSSQQIAARHAVIRALSTQYSALGHFEEGRGQRGCCENQRTGSSRPCRDGAGRPPSPDPSRAPQGRDAAGFVRYAWLWASVRCTVQSSRTDNSPAPRVSHTRQGAAKMADKILVGTCNWSDHLGFYPSGRQTD